MKVVEFGSEFDLNANNAFILSDNNGFFAKQNLRKYRSGRDALKALAIKCSNQTKKVLLPALCCESMVLPFTTNGYQPIFYKLNSDYTANVEDVEKKIEKNCIFLYISYFGIQPFETKYLEKWRTEKGVILVEDRTHNALQTISETNFVPDVTMLSIRKWISIPDGGLLWGKKVIDVNLLDNPSFANIRVKAMEKKSLYLNQGDELLKGEYLNMLSEASKILDESSLPYNMNSKSVQLLEKIDFEAILCKRQENVKALQLGLSDLEKSGKILFITKNPQESTLYFPILVKERDMVQKILAEKKIYCPVIWPVPQDAIGVCEVADYTAKHMLAIPCDQRYDIKDMKYIADTICRLFA